MKAKLGLILLLVLSPAARLGAEEPEAGPPVPAREEPAAHEESRAKLYWKEGETVFESESFRVALSNRIQFRFVNLWPDETLQIPGTTAPGYAIGTFRIRRAKTSLSGWFWKKELGYELQLGWAGSDSAGGSSTFSGLEDARLSWDASGKGQLQINLGQYKVPFGRQELTSSERQQFVDRSILSGEFTRGRDVGVSVSGRVAGGKLDYAAGIFNGNGRNKPINDNGKYQYDARVVLEPWGDVRYSEGDFESKDKPLVALAVQFEHNDTRGASNATEHKNVTFGGDLVVKYKGLSLFGEYFDRKRTPGRLASSPGGPSVIPGAPFHSNGYNLQAGYFVKREKLEIAFRYANWDPSDAVSGDDQKEVGGAVGYFFLKHRLKLQGDLRQLEDGYRGTTDTELRLQTQFVF